MSNPTPNLEIYEAFAFTIFPQDAEKRNSLFEDLKLGRYKDFSESTISEAVDFFIAYKHFPQIPCEVVQPVLKTADKQNLKILAHVVGCECCQKV